MTRALVVIDVQESFRARPSWAEFDNQQIAVAVQRLVDDARAAGDLVVWVLHSEPGSGTPFDPASGLVRLFDELTAGPGEPVLVKTAHNAFTTTNLAQLLTERQIHELTVCGIRTEQCVETTARLAADLGYAVTFVIDATATSPVARPGSRTLTPAEIKERTEAALADRFATVTTVDELLGVPLGG